MVRYFVKEEGPLNFPPYSRGGSYRVWDGWKKEVIREINWFEQRGAPIDDGSKTLSKREAHEQAVSLTRTLNEQVGAAEAYLRRK
ncbi:hypothetical protein [Burkholderia contaminans]|uniref:Uncharacterized protein n=1 Tax=Burkholderia contaminans TaxID=488447 RepID=A0A6P3BS37_9BURK|nr:hypothetical protein [Burkholderia contaminans]VWD62390.1 hypothetical protein BCO71033_06752 [Burkholderia contaminans]